MDLQQRQKPQEIPWEENRIRIFSVSARAILDMFIHWSRGLPECVTLPDYEAIPEGYKVVGLHHDFASNSIQIAVAHPSFEIVPPGQFIPSVPHPMYVKAVMLRELSPTQRTEKEQENQAHDAMMELHGTLGCAGG